MFRLLALLALASICLVGCPGPAIPPAGTVILKRVPEVAAEWSRDSRSDGMLMLEVVGPAKASVGTEATLAVSLVNVSKKPLLVPAMPRLLGGHQVWPSRFEVFLYTGPPEGYGMPTVGLDTYEHELMSLQPGQRVTAMFQFIPRVSGPAYWRARFHNDRDRVMVRMLYQRRFGDAARGGWFGYPTYRAESAARPNVWRGSLWASAPVEIFLPDERALLHEMSDIATDGLYDAGILVRAAYRAQHPNEFSALALCRLATSIGDKSSTERTHHFLLLIPMILEGVGLRCLPQVIAEAKDPENPWSLREHLAKCLLSLWAGDRTRRREIGGHYMEVTLSDEAFKAIEDALFELARDPDEGFAKMVMDALQAHPRWKGSR